MTLLVLIVGGFLLVQVIWLVMLADAKMMDLHHRWHKRRHGGVNALGTTAVPM